MVEFIGLPRLNEGQLATICSEIDNETRNYIFSYISKKDVIDLNVEIEADQNDILNLTIDISLEVSPFVSLDIDKLTEEALDFAFKIAERKLKNLAEKVRK